MSGIRDQGCSNCKYGGTHPIELFLSTKFTIEGVLLSIFFKEPKRLLLHTPSFFNFFSSSSLRRWTAARISHPLRFSGETGENVSQLLLDFQFQSLGKNRKWAVRVVCSLALWHRQMRYTIQVRNPLLIAWKQPPQTKGCTVVQLQTIISKPSKAHQKALWNTNSPLEISQFRKRTECRSVFPTASRYVAWSAYVRWKQGLLRVAESLRESWSPDVIAFYTLIKPFPPASHWKSGISKLFARQNPRIMCSSPS